MEAATAMSVSATAELKSLATVTFWTIACMTYARLASSLTSPGPSRLAVLLPAIAALSVLPGSFSSILFRVFGAFFVAWLCVFKLLLLSSGAGPLDPSLPLPVFLAISSLPIELRRRPKSSSLPPPEPSRLTASLLSAAGVRAAALLGLIFVYRRHAQFHPFVLFIAYATHAYLVLELLLGAAAAPTAALLGLDLEPQFDAPYLAASIGEFWGRRWNRIGSGILRQSVYNPIRRRRGGHAAGVMATFFVSGFMHEALFCYFAPAPATGEITFYFVLQGACVVAERWARRRRSGGLPVVVAAPLAMGFLTATGYWLLFPAFRRSKAEEQVVEDSLAAMEFLEAAGRDLAAPILRRFSGGGMPPSL